MHRKGYFIALMAASLCCGAVARAQDDAADQHRRIEGVDRSVDASPQAVKPEVPTGMNATGGTAKTHPAQSASSWGISVKSASAATRSSSQTSVERTSTNPAANPAVAAAEKAKLANQATPTTASARSQTGSIGREKLSSTASAKSASTVGKIGASTGRDAATGTHGTSTMSSASSAGASSSVAHGLGAHSLGASSSLGLSGGSRLSVREQANSKKARQKRSTAHGLLSSGEKNVAPGMKGPATHDAKPPYGVNSNSDSFHPGQK